MLSPEYHLPVLAVSVALVNVPFGFARAGLKKFSPGWFVAVHAPVPLVVALRLAGGVTWRMGVFGILVVAFFGGQWVGATIRGLLERQ
jgi:hypothetical protein